LFELMKDFFCCSWIPLWWKQPTMVGLNALDFYLMRALKSTFKISLCVPVIVRFLLCFSLCLLVS
jgi:hypothetical protein